MPARVVLIVAALLLVGCPKKATTTSGSAAVQSHADVAKVLTASDRLQGRKRVAVGGKTFRSDCSGFVSGCWYAARKDLIDGSARGSSGTELIYDTLRRAGRIVPATAVRPGDLAFFHDTYDRNRNGVRDDRFTHVALVETVDADGTVHYAHFASGKVKRGVLHPRRSDDAKDGSGKALNSYLRRGKGRVLAGQLVFAFGRP